MAAASRAPSPSPLLLGLPAHYVARDDLLAQIRQAVTAPNGPDGPVVALVGPGGAGKTPLVQATVRDPNVRKRFPKEPLSARLGPDARGESAAEPHLAAWLRELGGDPAVGSTLEEKAEQMRRLLARGRPRLLLMDDVWDAEAARLLVAARGPCPVLLITRSPGVIAQIDPGARQIRVGGMAAEEARRLEEKIVGRKITDPEWEGQIRPALERLGFLPEMVKQAALQARKGRRWEEIRRGPFGKGGDGERAYGWNYRRLGRGDRRRFAALGVMAPGLLAEEEVIALWAILALPPRRADDPRWRASCQRTLERLVEVGLLEPMGESSGMYRLHPLAADFALGRLSRGWLGGGGGNGRCGHTRPCICSG